MRRIRRPSAPVVIAVTALVVALAVPAYAATYFTKADGRRIVRVLPSNGLTGKQIRESRLGRVPRATQADASRNAGRAVNADHAEKATDADKLGGKEASAYAAAALVQRVSAKLAFGEDVTLVTNGPLSLHARCTMTELGGMMPPNSVVRVYAATAEADGFVVGTKHDSNAPGNTPAKPLAGGASPSDFLQPTTTPQDAEVWSLGHPTADKTPFVGNGAGRGFVAAKSGPVIAADGDGLVLALHAFGADCAVLGNVRLDAVG